MPATSRAAAARRRGSPYMYARAGGRAPLGSNPVHALDRAPAGVIDCMVEVWISPETFLLTHIAWRQRHAPRRNRRYYSIARRQAARVLPLHTPSISPANNRLMSFWGRGPCTHFGTSQTAAAAATQNECRDPVPRNSSALGVVFGEGGGDGGAFGHADFEGRGQLLAQ